MSPIPLYSSLYFSIVLFILNQKQITMRNYILSGMAIVTFSLFNSCSECDEFHIKESEVPKAVMDAFRAKYPSVSVDQWEAEHEDGKFFFGAEFKDGGKEMEVHITPDGTSVAEEK